MTTAIRSLSRAEQRASRAEAEAEAARATRDRALDEAANAEAEVVDLKRRLEAIRQLALKPAVDARAILRLASLPGGNRA